MPAGESEILHVHAALLALEQPEPRLTAVVERRYFGGHTEAGIADTLGLPNARCGATGKRRTWC